jgi:hypothetical protein
MASINDTKYTELYEQMVKLSQEELAQKYIELQMQADQYVDQLSKFSEREWILEPALLKEVVPEEKIHYEYMMDFRREEIQLIEREEIVMQEKIVELTALRIEAFKSLEELEKEEELKLKEQKKEHKSKS